MAEIVGIFGDYSTGKSHSISGLDPQETYLITVAKHHLPFPGWKQSYRRKKGDKGEKANWYVVNPAMDDVAGRPESYPKTILKAITLINQKRPDVKVIVIDDTTYVQSESYMARVKESGWGKWNDLAEDIWFMLREPVKHFREDLIIFLMWHTEVVDVDTGDAVGTTKKLKAKTIGKSIDKYIGIEGLFRIVLHTHVEQMEEDPSKRYKFLTNNFGSTTAKSPSGMFGNALIPNDLGYVKKRIVEYDEQGIVEEWKGDEMFPNEEPTDDSPKEETNIA